MFVVSELHALEVSRYGSCDAPRSSRASGSGRHFISSNRTKTRGLPLAMSVTIRPARVRVLHLVSRGTRIMTWVCNRQTTLRPCRPVTYRTFQRTIPCAIVSVSSCLIPFAFPTALPDLYHAMTWPSLSYVAEDAKGRIVGYVLAKMWVRQISAFSSHN